MEIGKQRAQRLGMKMRNSELHWKELQLFRLAVACSEIARASIEDEKTRLLQLVLPQKRISERASN